MGICSFQIEVEKQGFPTPWDITGQKFQGLGLKLKAFILSFRDLYDHSCQKIMGVARFRLRSAFLCFEVNLIRVCHHGNPAFASTALLPVFSTVTAKSRYSKRRRQNVLPQPWLHPMLPSFGTQQPLSQAQQGAWLPHLTMMGLSVHASLRRC